MNTPSHFLMTAVLRKGLPNFEMPASAVLLGSVAPDLPLYLLSFGGLFYFHSILGWSLEDSARRIFDQLYFRDYTWIACHSLLHSPLNLTFGLLATRYWRIPKSVARWWQWFFLSCLLHSIVDILTHYDDGPLVLWPIDWTVRFQSPISYWDPRHFGREFAALELAFCIAMVAYLSLPWLGKHLSGRSPNDHDS